MHVESLQEMTSNLLIYGKGNILDVGSLDVKGKGNYRTVIPENCTYVGVDLVAGPNVDVVMEIDKIPYTDNYFDTVISGQCFEHVENPFSLIKECARVLKIGGHFLGVAPFVFGVHRYPVDCWRILPDGWISLFNHAGFSTVKTYLYAAADSGRPEGPVNGRRITSQVIDCWGIANK